MQNSFHRDKQTASSQNLEPHAQSALHAPKISHLAPIQKLAPENIQHIMGYSSVQENRKLANTCRDFRNATRGVLGNKNQQKYLFEKFKSLKERPDQQVQLLNAHKLMWKRTGPLGPHNPPLAEDPTFVRIWPWRLTFASHSNLKYNESRDYIQKQLHELFDGDTDCHWRQLCIGIDFGQVRSGLPIRALHAVRSATIAKHAWSPSKELQAIQRGPLAKYFEFVYLNACQPDLGSFEGHCLRYHWDLLPRFQMFMDTMSGSKFTSCVNSIQHLKIGFEHQYQMMGEPYHYRRCLTPLRFDQFRNLRSLIILAGPRGNSGTRELTLGPVRYPDSLKHLEVHKTRFSTPQRFPPQLHTLVFEMVEFVHPLVMEKLPSKLVHLKILACENVAGHSLGQLETLQTIELSYMNGMGQKILNTFTSPHLREVRITSCRLEGQITRIPAHDSLQVLRLVGGIYSDPISLAWTGLRELSICQLDIHKIPDLRGFHRLETLNLSYTRLKDEEGQFERLPTCLEGLSLLSNPVVNVDLHHLTSLRWVDLQETHIKHDTVKFPPSLVRLSLLECKRLTQLPSLDHLPKLKAIALEQTPHFNLGDDVKSRLEKNGCKLVHPQLWWSDIAKD